jgi:hypothetical protein
LGWHFWRLLYCFFFLLLLKDNIVQMLTEISPNDEHLVFQQDETSPHYALPIRPYLDRKFPGQWIGRRVAIRWPSRPLDLSPREFFLWGYLKSKIYATQPDSLED